MKILVTGAAGQLGTDLVKEINRRGHTCVGTGIEKDMSTEGRYAQLDITDRNAVFELIETEKPDVVIHCAAWTAVDDAEDDKNKDTVYAVNVTGTGNIAEACSKTGAVMMYISTDYVFGGEGIEPWKPDDKCFDPLGYYGLTKLEGEKEVEKALERFFIIRISWVFGKNGKNFVQTMLDLGKKLPEIRVINDQIGSPTYTPDLSVLLVDMAESDKYGFYHATNEGEYISWYDLAREIFKMAGYDTVVIPVTTAEYGVSKAKRPLNSRMERSKLSDNGFKRLPDWKDALKRYLEETDV